MEDKGRRRRRGIEFIELQMEEKFFYSATIFLVFFCWGLCGLWWRPRLMVCGNKRNVIGGF